mmetsp:Transcript_55583/g.162480  ORF Transcript_55583/g.162480 Transcript_55583/m.162480 type:complete len:274 (+) Transcript_55583:401-1222(+)
MLNSPASTKSSCTGCSVIRFGWKMRTGCGRSGIQELVQSTCSVPGGVGTVPRSRSIWSSCTARTRPSLTMSLIRRSCSSSCCGRAAPWKPSCFWSGSRRQSRLLRSSSRDSSSRLVLFMVALKYSWVVSTIRVPSMASRHMNQWSRGITHWILEGSRPVPNSHRITSMAVLPAPRTTYFEGGLGTEERKLGGTTKVPRPISKDGGRAEGDSTRKNVESTILQLVGIFHTVLGSISETTSSSLNVHFGKYRTQPVLTKSSMTAPKYTRSSSVEA